MSDKRVIITHRDGRSYSVTEAAFHKLYEDDGFTIEKPEEPSDFITDVPAPAARRGRRKRTRKDA